jgi:hypothetical protein
MFEFCFDCGFDGRGDGLLAELCEQRVKVDRRSAWFLKARIDLRVCELRVLAAETAVSWGRACERERLTRGLPPPPRDDEPDEA